MIISFINCNRKRIAFTNVPFSERLLFIDSDGKDGGNDLDLVTSLEFSGKEREHTLWDGHSDHDAVSIGMIYKCILLKIVSQCCYCLNVYNIKYTHT